MLATEKTDGSEAQGRTLFCTGLTQEVTKSLLYELFLTAGPIQSVQVPTVPEDKDQKPPLCNEVQGSTGNKNRRSRPRSGVGGKTKIVRSGSNVTPVIVDIPRIHSRNDTGNTVKKPRGVSKADQEATGTTKKIPSGDGDVPDASETTRKTRSDGDAGVTARKTLHEAHSSKTARPSDHVLSCPEDVDNRGAVQDVEDESKSTGSGEEQQFSLNDKILSRYRVLQHQGFAFILYRYKQSVEYAMHIFQGTKLFGRSIVLRPSTLVVTSKDTRRPALGDHHPSKGRGYGVTEGSRKHPTGKQRGNGYLEDNKKHHPNKGRGVGVIIDGSRKYHASRERGDRGEAGGRNHYASKERGDGGFEGKEKGRLVTGQSDGVSEFNRRGRGDRAQQGVLRTMIFERSVAEATTSRQTKASANFQRSLNLRARINEMDLRNKLRPKTQKPIMEPGGFLSLDCTRPQPSPPGLTRDARHYKSRMNCDYLPINEVKDDPPKRQTRSRRRHRRKSQAASSDLEPTGSPQPIM